jgi:nucleoside-diphosphate-sugar epimerase
VKILVTGASGFLGSTLAAGWTGDGHCVMQTAAGSAAGPPAGRLKFRLGEPFDTKALHGIEVIVHAAHAFGEGTFTANVHGTQALFEAGRAAGARRQIFIGSASAVPDAPSDYGRIKFALERFFVDQGQPVVRPGLVLGAGGMFGRVMDKVLQYPVIPMLGGSDHRVPVVGVQDFVASMTRILSSDLSGVFNLANAEAVPMRQLLEILARLSGRRRLFVEISAGLAESLLLAAERLRIPLPVSSGGVRALKQSRRAVPGESDLMRLIGTESTLEAAIAAALEERARQRRGSVAVGQR